ncbi:hypothetical protein CQ017_13045 [Arthrobacter sp. MYb224]|uniref:hypothetical protein n=1 Tax=Micrococcaceae TaxID=1268 RepID=UPI000CFD1DCE|nr:MULTISPECIES: hypothetical protein [unclassified Arthrobacter]PQZ97681.1 hypothetical protein CQ017_13045 [Arthrobacter sp. MYb224]PRA04087.1 hypothetical protein CQ019_06985 [Arthrobacter sp. MYb229]PRB52001.1 hypothetical protein CQ013_09595 [Arthrobacter sp. MYb216]
MSKKSAAGKLLAFGVFVGLVALGVAMWKASRPVEDPWENEPKIAEPQQPVESREANVAEVQNLISED